MKPDERLQSSESLDDLSRELYAYSRNGAKLYLDGVEAAAWEIVEAYRFNDGACYMRDYVKRCDGRLEELRFDRVAEKQDES